MLAANSQHPESQPIIQHHRNHSSKTQLAANLPRNCRWSGKTAAKHPQTCRKLPLERQVTGNLRQLSHPISPEISSAIMIVVAFVFARITSGITDASTTINPSTAYISQRGETTAIRSDNGPILHVPDE